MPSKDNILLIIAARGGSKGVKNKNTKILMGKPLIAYTIQQAFKWGKAADIVCSTDSRKIAKLAKQYGVKIPFKRPKNLAGDKIPKIEVLRHALFECERIYKKKYHIIVDLDVTSPIRKIVDLDNCLRLFRKNRPDTLFSVVKSRRNPYFNMVEKKNNGRLSLSKCLKKKVFGRQAAPLVYDMNASIYFYKREYLLNSKNNAVVSKISLAYIMDEISGVDIDSELDFKFIEFLMKKGVWKSEV